MKAYLILPLLFTSSMLHAFTLRDQGFFDVGLGPKRIDPITINREKTEYYIGPCFQTSVGIGYKNGLGVSLVYQFNYNKRKSGPLNPTDPTVNEKYATEFTNYIAGLNFIYKLLPSSEVAFFLQGGPGIVVNTDQKLSPTTSTQTDTTETTVKSDGTSSVVTTEDTTQESEAFSFYENITFGYQVGGGIEYRQDAHKAIVMQVNYLSTHIYQSTFDPQDSTSVISSLDDELEGLSGHLSLRYYL
ncbi:hypothetical protein [Candidatus Synchoanobacter obligatus]|uniref:Outer membrane protein beta-barrel domain-containing protein n=1 Tax=Candidatus Synchoanobacter obligatus TaxID=2919597 RepID=A0ABT1L445_9GAMM|nr:hypothetical protein [Candidatus Synchoanobacter obligatus]MCP8351957.1 hypothetical protein [Candidatus Synchoanobacter obligatus]